MPIVPIGTGRVPPTPSERASEWIAFADAIEIIAASLGTPLTDSSGSYWAEDADDGERSATFEACAQLRNALSRGDLMAYGRLGSNDHNPIPAIEWATRDVTAYEGEWMNAPYTRFMVARSQVGRLWAAERPQPLPGGRPPKIDWAEVKARALVGVAANPLISRYKLAESLRVGSTADVNDRTIKKKLAEWGLGVAPTR